MRNKKSKQKDFEKLRLRNDEIKDIIGIIPKWFVRFGIQVIFFFLLIFLLGCWFFKYPDIVAAKVQITANNIPASILARSNGRIEKIFVKNNQDVKNNEIIAIIANTADYKEVFAMKSQIDSLGSILSGKDTSILVVTTNFIRLGDIQPYYSSYVKKIKDYQNFVSLNYHRKKISSLKFEILLQESNLKKLNDRLSYSKEQLQLTRNQYERDSLLFKNQVIALVDFERSKNSYIESKSNLEYANSEIVNIGLQITRLNQNILDLSSQRLEQTTQQYNSLKESYDVLLSHTADWENSYILKSSIDGIITFTRVWNTNQNIKIGDIIFTIIPSGSTSYIAKIQLPVGSSGKVKIGQSIVIKLDDYPYMEYGMLRGYINNISLVSSDNLYFAEAIFPLKLITTYGLDISMKSEYNGNGEIITRNQRLIYKFINPLKAFWDKNQIK